MKPTKRKGQQQVKNLDLKLIRECILDLPSKEIGEKVGYSHVSVLRFERDYPIPPEFISRFKRVYGFTDSDMEAIRKAAELIYSVRKERLQ